MSMVFVVYKWLLLSSTTTLARVRHGCSQNTTKIDRSSHVCCSVLSSKLLKSGRTALHDVILGTVLEVAMLLFGTMLFIVLFHLSPASGDGLAVAPFVVI